MSERRILGRFIVIDPDVANGEPSFRGTDATVREVVERIANGEHWDTLIGQMEGALSRRAIAEALALCVDAFLDETRRLRERSDQTRLELGDYIVMDPAICHGTPTYRGSRVMVWQVLRALEDESDWEMIRHSWHGTATDPAIAESLLLALRMFLDRVSDFVVETVPA
ncbi:MAG: DUF433 domain-containing protein [Dehalococcoidia bacterium]